MANELVVELPDNDKVLDAQTVKQDFPIFKEVGQDPFVYLDSAASAQRPSKVLEAMDSYYHTTHANVHRGVYRVAEQATNLYEEARSHLGRFLGAPKPELEIVFTKNATEAFNLFAHGYGRKILGPNDVVLLTKMEHHANIVPWMILREQIGFEIRFIDIDAEGQLVLDNIEQQLKGVKILGVTMASNVLGTLNPIKQLTEYAHQEGAIVIADGAQYSPHLPTNLQVLGVDAYCITGHKMLGPTGIGALWARTSILEEMYPFLGGGEMIRNVTTEGFTTNDIPHKFEAGTPPIAEAVGLSAALTYLEEIGLENIRAHELSLTSYAMEQLHERLGSEIKIFGPENPSARSGVISFELKDVHPHDVSQILDQEGVCVRAGHHCAKPLMTSLNVPATARASFYLYNTESDVDSLVSALVKTVEFFR
ncbi:cysteine desulfurase / selenocysteine lyase [Ferrithrix thermotolerans DSM 19514]|uniref:Cysteine desulfurase n=1 Tax=Ferrithrix thermotolerans DSM 19514 TaxID=1121881 RepID=A0A1M4V892_9ACTN|nr:SufS family cysteine desulfurase [Ferrithrix thermotolerans]SHE65185.1 cysteine desulfurase / selenocysteine lyase [Ferrithrix thermotolerans DSM 19514]